MDSKNHKDTSQNRLLVATGVLTFLYFAGAHFTALSIVGATVTFTNEDALVEFAWVIWLYYYVRTYQYYKEEGLKVFDNAMERSYSASFGHLLVDLTPDEFDLLDDDDAIKASIIRLGFRDRAGLLKRAGDHEPLKRVRQARTDLPPSTTRPLQSASEKKLLAPNSESQAMDRPRLWLRCRCLSACRSIYPSRTTQVLCAVAILDSLSPVDDPPARNIVPATFHRESGSARDWPSPSLVRHLHALAECSNIGTLVALVALNSWSSLLWAFDF